MITSTILQLLEQIESITANEKEISIQFIQPGKRMQNSYIERFHRLSREALLDAYLFFDLYQVKQLTLEWMIEYNERRPHEALNNLTPMEWNENLSKSNEPLKITVSRKGYLHLIN